MLKYASVSGKNYNGKTKQENNYMLEFVTTTCDLKKNSKPIPFEKRLKYGELFTELESSEDVHFWDEYTTIEMDSVLKMERIGMRGKEYFKVTNGGFKGKSKRDFKIKLYNLTKRITIGYALNGAFFKSIDQKQVWLGYIDQTNMGLKDIPSLKIIPAATFGFAYELNPYKQLRIDFTDGLFNSNVNKSTSIKFYQYYLIKKRGNPVFVTASIGLSIGKIGLRLGEISSGNDIIVSGKNLGKKSTVFLGNRYTNGQIGLGLEYRKKRLSYFGEFSYTQNIHTKDILLLRIKKNIFFTKTVVTDYPSKEISISSENLNLGISRTSMAFGIHLRL